MKRKKARKMLRALRKVQRVCKGQVSCAECMFGWKDEIGAACALVEEPAFWTLKKLGNRLPQTKENAKGNTDGEG